MNRGGAARNAGDHNRIVVALPIATGAKVPGGQASNLLYVAAPPRETSSGMSLDACARMRFVIPLLAIALGGCPSSQHPGHGDDDQADAGMPDAPGPTCAMVIPTCSTTIVTHVPNAHTVVLRGDFATDGWTAGVPMTQAADGSWQAAIPANDEQVVVYKLFVDGAWIADPENPRKSPDGYGAFNSVVRVDCDHCPARPAMDWRDAIMYFIMIDRFSDGDASNNAPVDGAEFPGQYQGGDFAGITQKIEGGYFTDLGIRRSGSRRRSTTPRATTAPTATSTPATTAYWPKDETLIDSHYGTLDELKAMVASAHAHGIQILIDYVMNHVTTDSPTYLQNPSWFWPDNGSGDSCTSARQGNPTFNTVCWFDTFLPDLQHARRRRAQVGPGRAVMWAKQLGIDGFQLDAVGQVETVWFTDLRARERGARVGSALLHGRQRRSTATAISSSRTSTRTRARRSVRFPAGAGQVLLDAGSAATATCRISPIGFLARATTGYYGELGRDVERSSATTTCLARSASPTTARCSARGTAARSARGRTSRSSPPTRTRSSASPSRTRSCSRRPGCR